MVLVVRNSPANAGDKRGLGSIPGLEKSPGGGHGNPLQSSCLRNPMDRGAWQATAHGVAKSRTRLKWLSTWARGLWMAQDHSYQGLSCSDLNFSSVQSLTRVRLLATPWTAARQASLSITNSQSPPKPMSIESVMPSNHLILCRPLLFLPSVFPSIRILI